MPDNINEWYALALANSNFVQSTFYDAIQSFFESTPIYIQLKNEGKLAAGLKVYYTVSKKMKSLTANISGVLQQFSEFIIVAKFEQQNIDLVRTTFENEIEKLIQKHQVNKLIVSGYFGPSNQLIQYSKSKLVKDVHFNIATVDIQKNDEELLKSFNRNTKRNVQKAIEEQLKFVKAKDDLSDFFEVMHAIYIKQQTGVNVPNFKYIHRAYELFIKHKMVDVYMVYKGETPIAAMYFYKFGKKAYSSYGGAVKNNFGAGQFGYYELMKVYRDEGITDFIFGQTGSSNKYLNDKFNVGITNFKLGFSPTEQPSFTQHFIFSPTKEKIWKAFLKLNALIRG